MSILYSCYVGAIALIFSTTQLTSLVVTFSSFNKTDIYYYSTLLLFSTTVKEVNNFMNTQEIISPFLIIQDFVSPLLCEQIVDDLEAYEPDVNVDGKPIKAIRSNEQYETILFDKIQEILPIIESHYNLEYRGTESVVFEWLPQESHGDPVCENGTYLRKQWLRTKERDVTAILFLCDYQDNVPFDSDYEVYGGKFEFPQHGFGFNPQRGTLIMYPSDPHFINVNAPVTYGDLFQVRIQITAKRPFIYDPKDFPGDYRSWFMEFA